MHSYAVQSHKYHNTRGLAALCAACAPGSYSRIRSAFPVAYSVTEVRARFWGLGNQKNRLDCLRIISRAMILCRSHLLSDSNSSETGCRSSASGFFLIRQAAHAAIPPVSLSLRGKFGGVRFSLYLCGRKYANGKD